MSLAETGQALGVDVVECIVVCAADLIALRHLGEELQRKGLFRPEREVPVRTRSVDNARRQLPPEAAALSLMLSTALLQELQQDNDGAERQVALCAKACTVVPLYKGVSSGKKPRNSSSNNPAPAECGGNHVTGVTLDMCYNCY